MRARLGHFRELRAPIRGRIASVLVVALTAVAGLGARGDGPGPDWNPLATQHYLNARAGWWLDWPSAARGQGTSCVSCHTTVPYALARPALAKLPGGSPAPEAAKRLFASVRTRVEKWDEVASTESEGMDPLAPFYRGSKRESALDTESVLNALILVANDPQAGGTLSEFASKALDHMWARQQAVGNWRWLDFGLRPWEKDSDYYGATLAAVAAGTAGDKYPRHLDAGVKAKTSVLRAYLKSELAVKPFLHNRALGLWAASHLKDVFTDAEKDRMVADLFAIQRPDGGWTLRDLGKTTTDQDATGWRIYGSHPDGAVSDAYATGLVVLALKRSGVRGENERLKKGISWLSTKQAADGTWPIVYVNKDRDPGNDIGKFKRDAGAAFAILALSEPG